MSKKTLWITQTALLLALLIAIQVTTSPLGNTLITGSLVNLVLIVAAVIGGLSSGLTVALLSPIFAYFLGIGPKFPQIVLCVALANALLTIIWSLIAGKEKGQLTTYLLAAATSAVAKFLLLYFSVVKFVVPVILGMPDPQAKIVSAAFSYPQLITALIGGGLSLLILPALSKAVSPKRAI